jgi:N6-adenosine-specific RNA methylase IME4
LSLQLSSIKKNPSNPRIIKDEKFARLKKSVKEFPQMMELRPIIVDESGMVLGGNMRLEALKALGHKEIPDEWVKRASELTEEQKKEFIVKDNSGFGEWDWDLLANEWSDYPLVDWGVDIPEDWANSEQPESLEAKELPEGKYSVIYADPPWEYSNSGFNQSAASHYMTMPLEDICAMSVTDLAADDCALLMWATSPLLKDSFQVIESWGFEYKASFVWVKDRAPGIGWYVNTKHELLLIAVKGQAVPSEKVDSVISGSVGRHSKKPDNVYGLIEQMYPNGKFIELFAREERDGWAVFGNQVAAN